MRISDWSSDVCSSDLDLTAGYLKERTQFGRKLAEFQAVSQQIAEVYITSRLLTLAARNAAWRVSEGLPAADDLAVATYWLAEDGLVALHTCHHLRSEEHTSELQSLMRNSYAVF